MVYSPLSLESLSLGTVLTWHLEVGDLPWRMQQEVAAFRGLEGEYRLAGREVRVVRRCGGEATQHQRDYVESLDISEAFMAIGEDLRWSKREDEDGEVTWWLELWRKGARHCIVYESVLGSLCSFMYKDDALHLPMQGEEGLEVFKKESVEAGVLRRVEKIRWQPPGSKEFVVSERSDAILRGRGGELVWRSREPVYCHKEGVELEVVCTYWAARL